MNDNTTSVTPGTTPALHSRKRRPAAPLALLLALSLLLASCGGGSNSGTAGSAEPAAEKTEALAETPAAEPAEAETQTETPEAGAASSSDAIWANMDQLKQLSIGEIGCISLTTYTEGGIRNVNVTDPAKIEELYLRLCNVRLGSQTDMAVTDDGLDVDVACGDRVLSFIFEGDILVLDDTNRYDVEQLDTLKRYVEKLLEEAAEAAKAENAGSAAEAEEAEAPAAAVSDDEKAFASSTMDFSFLYDKAHTAYITETGAAELAINGDTSLVGLFVSAADAANMPETSQIIEEAMFNETQKYMQAIAQQPATNEITVDGHELEGYVFSYSDRQGRTVDSTYYIEVRDGKYLFFKTEAYRDADDYWAAYDAFEKAVLTLQLSRDAYGDTDVIPGEIGTDNTPEDSEPPQDFGQNSTSPAYSDTFEGDYYFDVDEDKYLVIADGNTTMVYTGGGMNMPCFTVDDETENIPRDDIGTHIVLTKNNLIAQLQNRLVDEPKIITIQNGDRKLVGLEYAYSSVAGDRTIESCYLLEPIGDFVFSWYGLWNRGDSETANVLVHAIDTFALK